MDDQEAADCSDELVTSPFIPTQPQARRRAIIVGSRRKGITLNNPSVVSLQMQWKDMRMTTISDFFKR
jgi:hypothetical protein